jgi:predicted amidohydrolase
VAAPKIALLQMLVTESEPANLERAHHFIREAAKAGADFAVLPEMFCCPYDTAVFARYAQPDGGERWQTLAGWARENALWLVAGSVPETGSGGKVYNTAYVFDRVGKQKAKHREIHLFDIDVAGGQAYRESAAVLAGETPTVFATEFGNMGLMICFDVRFPPLAAEIATRGAKILFVPAAFNPTTGPAHWELLFRARAVDNQLFTVGVASAQNDALAYRSYGHSLAVSPWGCVLTELDGREGFALVELNLDEIDRVRGEIVLK